MGKWLHAVPVWSQLANSGARARPTEPQRDDARSRGSKS